MQALFARDEGEGQAEPQAKRSVYAMLSDAADLQLFGCLEPWMAKDNQMLLYCKTINISFGGTWHYATIITFSVKLEKILNNTLFGA